METSAAATATRSLLAIILVLLTASALIGLDAGAAEAQGHYRRGQGRTQGEAPAAVGMAEPTPYAFAGSEVLLTAGTDLQAAVDGHPAGTHFRIGAGVHRLQSVRPKDGMTFTGEPGAVLSGAAVLPSQAFRSAGRVWIIDGQTAEGFTTGQTEVGHERHAAPNDLFLDGVLADHVANRAAVDAPGEWFFDYDLDQVVIADRPDAFTSIELSVVESAFRSTARDVTIQHLTITRYASPSQHGAVHAAEGLGWEMANLTVSQAHGTGIRVGPGSHVHHSRVIASGQLGIGGTDEHEGLEAPVVVEHNEIAGNRTLRYDWGWEGGATKFALTDGMVFQQNWVHDNRGPGIWFDVDNTAAVIRSNVVEANDQAGIFYEISYGAEIYDNTIRGNGRTAVGDLGAGVHVASSRDVNIHHNAIYGNRSAVMAVQEDRGEGAHGPRVTTGLDVHHNAITPGEVPTGIRVRQGDEQHYQSAVGNRFHANTYHVEQGSIAFWAGAHLDLRGWQQAGQDVDASLAPAGQEPQLPSSAQGFQSVPAGAPTR